VTATATATVSLTALKQSAAGFTILATNTTATASTSIVGNVIAFHD
jgi:hypothetical protein